MNILLTSVGRRTYLVKYFKQALNGEGKIFASNSIMTYTMTQADGYVVTPQIYDESYIAFLIEYCLKENITAIISCFDIDLPVLASNKKRFDEKGITVVVSSLEVAKICNDKWLTYKNIIRYGLLSPKTYCDIKDVMIELANGSLSYPVVLKPRWGMGSIGIFKAENDEELNVLYKKLHREIFQTYLKFESEEDKERCIIFQELVQAQEYGLDVFNDLNSNFVTLVAKKKIAMRAGETDIAEIVNNKPFLKVGKALSSHLRHVANLDVDCFLDDKGNVYILELNCRFGGQYPFSHLAGVDFPRQIIEWLKGGKTNTSYMIPSIGVKGCKEITPIKIEI